MGFFTFVVLPKFKIFVMRAVEKLLNDEYINSYFLKILIAIIIVIVKINKNMKRVRK